MASPVADSYSVSAGAIRGGRFNWPAWRQAVAPNTWARIGSNKLDDLDPKNNAAINPDYPSSPEWYGNMGFMALTNNWCGACWDEVAGIFWIPIGGGHQGYGGNEGYKIDMMADAPAWQMTRNPSGAIGNTITTKDGQEATGVQADGRLRTGHTYDHLVYLPGRGPLWVCQSAQWFNSGQTLMTWSMDPATGEWTHRCTNSSITGAFDMGCAYDATRDVVWLRTNANAKLRKLDLATWTWSLNASQDTPPAVNVSKLLYLPEHDVLVEFSGSMNANVQSAPTMAVWQLPAGTRATPTVSGSPPTGLQYASDYMGAAWDGARLLLWNNSTNTTAIGTLTPNGDLSVWTWGEIAAAAENAVTPTARFANGTLSRLQYSARLKGILLQQETSQKLYFYAFE